MGHFLSLDVVDPPTFAWTSPVRLVDTKDGPFRIRIQGARSQEPPRTTPAILGRDSCLIGKVEQGTKDYYLRKMFRNKKLYRIIPCNFSGEELYNMGFKVLLF